MLKQTITYENFDGIETTEDLYFNISKIELSDMMDVIPRLEAVQEKLQNTKAENVKPEDVREVLELVKTFMERSYGVRSEDGRRFIKTPEHWTEFTQTAAYDTLLFSLFENPAKGFDFLAGILPADLRAQVEAQAAQGQLDFNETPQPETDIIDGEIKVAPSITEDSVNMDELSDEELLKMKPQDLTRSQLMRAFALKNAQ